MNEAKLASLGSYRSLHLLSDFVLLISYYVLRSSDF